MREVKRPPMLHVNGYIIAKGQGYAGDEKCFEYEPAKAYMDHLEDAVARLKDENKRLRETMNTDRWKLQELHDRWTEVLFPQEDKHE